MRSEEACTAVLAADPHSWEAHRWRAAALGALGQHYGAVRDLRRALALCGTASPETGALAAELEEAERRRQQQPGQAAAALQPEQGAAAAAAQQAGASRLRSGSPVLTNLRAQWGRASWEGWPARLGLALAFCAGCVLLRLASEAVLGAAFPALDWAGEKLEWAYVRGLAPGRCGEPPGGRSLAALAVPACRFAAMLARGGVIILSILLKVAGVAVGVAVFALGALRDMSFVVGGVAVAAKVWRGK